MSHSHLPFKKAKTIGAAALLALSVSGAHAASLGKLTVLSALGQPLRAEIELVSVAEGEAESLVAKLAPIAAFQKTNIDYNPVLRSLRFEVLKKRARPVIRITSSRPMNDPFIAMLLELRSNRGRLTREYTFLLDPPELRAGAPAQVVAPTAVVTPQSRSTSYAPARSAQSVEVVKWREPATGKKPYVVKKKRPTKVRHRVRRGQSLRYVARTSRLRRVPLDQALVAIYRANPHAFMQENMNLLQIGKTLRIPDTQAARSISRAEARKVVKAHERDFANFRQRVAGQAAKAEPVRNGKAGQVAGGRIGTQSGLTPKAADGGRDRLKVSRAPLTDNAKTGRGTGASGKAGVADPALAEANARIQELEKSLSELKAMLQVRSQSLAAQQKQAQSLAAEAETMPAAEKKVEAVPGKLLVAAEDKKPESRKPEVEKTAGEKAGDEAVGEEKQVVLDEAGKPVAAIAPLADRKPVAKPAPKPKPKVKKKPRSKASSMLPGFLQDLMQNKLVMALIGVLLLLLIMLRMRKGRQKKAEKTLLTEDFEPSMDEAPTDAPEGSEAPQPNNNFFAAAAPAPAEGLLDAEEVDALAEAEVYLAYGRENQAIDVLKAGLRNNDERNDYRVKLLEIYAQKGDVYSFNTLASELHVMTEGKGEEWAHIAALGVTIAPNNPLFSQAEAVESDIAEEAPAEETVSEAVEEGAEEVEPPAASEEEEPVEAEAPESDPLADMARMNPEDVEEFAGEAPQESETPEAPLEFESTGEAVEAPAEEAQVEEAVGEEEVAPLEFDLGEPETEAEAEVPEAEEEEATQAEVPQEEMLPPLNF